MIVNAGKKFVLTFGKYKGFRVDDVLKTNMQYIRWVQENVPFIKFDDEVRKIIALKSEMRHVLHLFWMRPINLLKDGDRFIKIEATSGVAVGGKIEYPSGSAPHYRRTFMWAMQFPSRELLLNAEQEVHDELQHLRKIPKKQFDGWLKCYNSADDKEIKNIVTKVLLAYDVLTPRSRGSTRLNDAKRRRNEQKAASELIRSEKAAKLKIFTEAEDAYEKSRPK